MPTILLSTVAAAIERFVDARSVRTQELLRKVDVGLRKCLGALPTCDLVALPLSSPG